MASHISLYSWFSCSSSILVELEFRVYLGIFSRGRKTGRPREKPSEQGREPITNSTHIKHRSWESNLRHIDGKRAPSPLRHPCSPILSLFIAMQGNHGVL